MNWQQIKDDWPRLKESVRKRWPRLDEQTFSQVAGNRTALMEAVQEEYGLPLEDAGVEVDRWADTVSDHGTGEWSATEP